MQSSKLRQRPNCRLKWTAKQSGNSYPLVSSRSPADTLCVRTTIACVTEPLGSITVERQLRFLKEPD